MKWQKHSTGYILICIWADAVGVGSPQTNSAMELRFGTIPKLDSYFVKVRAHTQRRQRGWRPRVLLFHLQQLETLTADRGVRSVRNKEAADWQRSANETCCYFFFFLFLNSAWPLQTCSDRKTKTLTHGLEYIRGGHLHRVMDWWWRLSHTGAEGESGKHKESDHCSNVVGCTDSIHSLGSTLSTQTIVFPLITVMMENLATAWAAAHALRFYLSKCSLSEPGFHLWWPFRLHLIWKCKHGESVPGFAEIRYWFHLKNVCICTADNSYEDALVLG